ncbi:MAG: T9SS type A sorting domain-containing protein, partial [Ignavibacteriales bacterium]|nr:T9SS type A sorting domain-containing protein [Ignavibacteriales bacterium]
PVTSVIVGLESFSAYASVINPGFTYNGSLATGDVFNNNNNPLTVTIAPNTPPNTSLRFSVNFLVNGVLDWQGVTVVVNPSFATQSNGKIQVTFTSKGTFGFNDYSANLQGDGFIYDTGSNLIFEGALITGNSASRISDVARNAGTGSTQNTDFLPKRPFAISYPGVFADAEGLTVFSDAGAGSSALGVTCSLKTYSFTSTAKENFVLMRYQFLNTGTGEIGNFYAGLFTDWDIAGGVNDYTNYDTIGRFGFQYQIGSSPAYVGVVALGATTGYYGVLNPGEDGGINIYDGFTDAEKWTTISGGLAKTSAGGGDVSFVSSVGPITLLPGVNTPVGFALIAGYNLDALRIAAQSARDSYAAILLDIDDKVVSRDVENFQVYGNYPNPFNPSTKISYFIPQADNISIQVFNRMGELVKTVFSGMQTSGYHSVDWNAIEMASGVYFCRVTAGQKSITKKLILLK